ncbi:MAG: hypothetical protein QOC83_6006, partial [Pseudonocardiales bacterium]|nr:hypothetical protein [Pseudonocardiales bacterium]
MTGLGSGPEAARSAGQQGGTGSRRGWRRGRRERAMVPAAEFTSYYGRPVVRPSPWEADIP